MIKLTDPNVKVIVFGRQFMNSLGQVRSFGEVGCRPDVVWLAIPAGPLAEAKTPLTFSKYINRFIKVTSFEEGMDFILNEYRDENVKYIISTDSDLAVALMDARYDELKDRFIFFNAGSTGQLSRYLSKEAQCRLAEQCGLKVPKSELVRRGELPKVVSYPLLTKTVDSFSRDWKKNYIICRNEAELIEAYQSIKVDEVLLQQFIERENEVALEGISFNQGEQLYMPVQGEYLRIEEFGYGSWKRNEAYHLGDELRDKLQQVFKTVKYSGVFEVEFMRTADGELYFLEINFRHTQYNHALTDMGINLCQIFAESELNGRLCIPNPDVVIEPRTVMNEEKEFFTYIETKMISWKNWIADIRKTDSFYLYDKRDLKPLMNRIVKYFKMVLVQAYYRKLKPAFSLKKRKAV